MQHRSIMRKNSVGVLFAVAGAALLASCAPESKKSEGAAAKPAVIAPEVKPTALPMRAYFGDLHMHTSWSFDAYSFKTTATPDDAYHFAKGAPLAHPAGGVYQLKRPLDFMAVTDHSEFLGVMRQTANPDSSLSKHPLAAQINSDSVKTRMDAFMKFAMAAIAGVGDLPKLDAKEIQKIMADAWSEEKRAANANYEPGKFTTLISYEWTSSPDGRNLHRNVIFGDNGPDRPFSSNDSNKPEDLWAYLDNMRKQGHKVMAIPHNSNVSDGSMWERVDSYGKPLTKDYALSRLRNEPLVEVTQVKGTSEVHPSLSRNDEFANFELLENYLFNSKPITKFEGGYVRSAYMMGLAMQDSYGFDPYRFGLVGASDSHTGLVPVDENAYTGKTLMDGTPKSRLDCTYCGGMDFRKFGASGLTAVWAKANTREALFDALERKETFATTGPRMQVRFFGGRAMDGVDPKKSNWIPTAYAQGVPMGSTLQGDAQKAPVFVVWAVKDPDGANLDRIQIVKLWSKGGVAKEKIFNVALSGNRKVDPKTGKAPAVGNTVNLKTVTYRNTIGASELSARWVDPEYDPKVPAGYYVRVLEIPTPRWSSFDAKTLGIAPPKDLPSTIQERAFTSPIWVGMPPA